MGIIVLISIMLTIPAVFAQCPSQCHCHSGVFNHEVICSELPNLFPNLSSLEQVTKPIRLHIQLHPSRTLSKSDFPLNSTINILKIKSKANPSIESEALIRLAPSLSNLSVENAGLSFKDRMTFLKGLMKLNKLVLSKNQQMEGVLHQSCFSNLSLISLEDIQLDNCNLTYIRQFVFKDLESLRTINLNSNRLESVVPALDHIRDLIRVDLGNNSIKMIRNEDFRGLGKLETLILSDNQHLTFEPNCFAELKFVLEELMLRNCKLDNVPKCIRNFTKLKKLDLADNPLTSFTRESLAGEMCLEELDVSGTNFPLSPTVFSAQKDYLRKLSLNRRNLIAVPTGTLENLPNLVTINLRKNKIKTVPGNAFQGYAITNVDLSENPVTTVDANFFSSIGFHLSVGLKKTKLEEVDFILEYKRDKFRKIDLMGTNLVCSCNLYKIMLALPKETLHGYCMDGLRKVFFMERSKFYLRNKYKCDRRRAKRFSEKVPENSRWSSWTLFGITRCTVTCGEGHTARIIVRECIPSMYACKGGSSVLHLASCNPDPMLVPCPENIILLDPDGSHSQPVDGGWSSWFYDDVIQCSVTCGIGRTIRALVRTCTNPSVRNAGKPCDGATMMYSNNDDICSTGFSCDDTTARVNGGWSMWTRINISRCSVTCGSGFTTITKIRRCTNPRPWNGGNNCTGYNAILEYGTCDTRATCPVNGGWSTWKIEKITYCTATCGIGTNIVHRVRQCSNPSPSNGGRECVGSKTERTNDNCDTGVKCGEPDGDVNGGWASLWHYSMTGKCSVTCGSGFRAVTKFRQCINPTPRNGGKMCSGESIKSVQETCHIKDGCPVDGGWTSWDVGERYTCSVTCGSGRRTLTHFRECTNPSPSYHGKLCIGFTEKITDETCNTGISCDVYSETNQEVAAIYTDMNEGSGGKAIHYDKESTAQNIDTNQGPGENAIDNEKESTAQNIDTNQGPGENAIDNEKELTAEYTDINQGFDAKGIDSAEDSRGLVKQHTSTDKKRENTNTLLGMPYQTFYLGLAVLAVFTMLALFMILRLRARTLNVLEDKQNESKEDKFGVMNPAFDSHDKSSIKSEL